MPSQTPSRGRGPVAIPLLCAVTALVAAACTSQRNADPGTPGGDGTVTISLTSDGCKPTPESVPAGVVTFNIDNKGADQVSEAELLSGGRMLGEQENLSPGLSGKFSLRLDNGKYQIYCPGAARERFDFAVTGTAKNSWRDNPALVKATDAYATWVTGEIGQLVAGTQAFVAAVDAGDLAQAGIRYPAARAHYERVEPVAEIWGDLDQNIDGRLDDFDKPGDFTGYHKLEQLIFEQHTLAGAQAVADPLLANVKHLQELVATATYQPAEIADGATSLVDEIQKSKVTGEEERYSHTDLIDFQANVDGAMEAFTVLLPALEKASPDVAKSVQDRYQDVTTALAPYHQTPGYLNTGFVDYSTVGQDARKKLSQAVNAFGEQLSKVADKVA